MRHDPTLTRWHPATKALVGVAVVALPYLAWTSLGEAPAAVAVAQRATLAVASDPAPQAGAVEEAALRQLPPLDELSVMIDRPLFSPTRRPLLAPVKPVVMDEEAVETDYYAEEPAAGGAPALRFVGTIGQDGNMTALVLRGDGVVVDKLVVGDEVDGWRVTQVTASQLIVEHEAERLVLNILQ